MKTHDTLGRRIAGNGAQSTGKLIELNDSDADLLELIHRHGSLSTAEIFALSGRSYQAVVRRLGLLYHEKNNGYGDRLIIVPPGHIGDDVFNTKYYAYDLTTTGREYLGDAGRYRENHPVTNNKLWRHDRLCSAITAWLHIGTSDEFIYHDQVVDELEAPSFQVGSKTIKPDGFCGIHYKKKDFRRIFIIEADYGNENMTTRHGRATIQGKFQAYEQWLSSGQFKHDLPEGVGVAILFVTVSPGRMNGMVKLADSSFATSIARNTFLFNHMPGFKPKYRPQKPSLEFFTTPWARAGRPPFNMS